jgi:hypothetical protein
MDPSALAGARPTQPTQPVGPRSALSRWEKEPPRTKTASVESQQHHRQKQDEKPHDNLLSARQEDPSERRNDDRLAIPSRE